MKYAKQKTKQKKFFKFSKNDLIKSFFIIFFFVVFAFLLINYDVLNFYCNGFSSVFASDLQVYFLDVGQASATLVILPGREAMVIDTGGGSTEDDFVSDIQFLLSKNGISEIDYLLLTHPDEDHTGGTVKLLEKFQVNKIYRPKVMSTSDDEIHNSFGYKTVTTNVYAKTITQIYSEPNAEVVFVEDEIISFGADTAMQIFSCEKDSYSSTNSYSPYIYLSHNSHSFLFTGDATTVRDEEFVDMLESKSWQMQIDFLQVAHHGSYYNTSEFFLEAISPRYAFVSAGEEGYPDSDVLERLKNVEVEEVFVTKESGMLAVGVEEDFYIRTLSDSLDLPFILVAFCCVCFAWLKFIVDRNFKLNRFVFMLKRRKFSV